MITIKESESVLRLGIAKTEGKTFQVVIIDLGEGLKEFGIPNHDKIELVYGEEEKQEVQN